MLPEELQDLIDEFEMISEEVGLSINIEKTKALSPDSTIFRMGYDTLEKAEEYIYLGHTLKLGKENQTTEIKYALHGQPQVN
ncbi:hypothetical protein Trydic_g10381 [Trypoxylus dichotomus]